VKKLQQQVAEQQGAVEEEVRQKAELREALVAAERHANGLLADVDSLHASLDQAERSRKALENDLSDAAERVNEFNAANASLASQKRKADADLAGLQADLDEAHVELKNVEERARKADSDLHKLAGELANEQVTRAGFEINLICFN